MKKEQMPALFLCIPKFLHTVIVFQEERRKYMLTKFGFKGKIQKRLIETATEDKFWELVKEEESVINEDADSQNENLNQNDLGHSPN